MASYWDGQHIYNATAGGRSDTDDFDEWSAGTGFELDGCVLDIGCGSGRMAERCTDYTGVDITPSFVAFCTERGLNVSLIEQPTDMPTGPFDRILMSSVMTHMPHADRLAYLPEIRSRLSGEALIDILPGAHDEGSVRAWHCDPETFHSDLEAAGFEVIRTFQWTARDDWTHLYFRVR